MSVDVSSLIVDRYYIDKITKEIEQLEKSLEERREKLSRQCTHPTFKVTEKYSGGGYDYLSSNTITHTCTICNKVLKHFDDPKYKGSHS